jgi:hypothetical protein
MLDIMAAQTQDDMCSIDERKALLSRRIASYRSLIEPVSRVWRSARGVVTSRQRGPTPNMSRHSSVR